MSSLTVVIGTPIVNDVLGHSGNNGAPIPADAGITFVSNAPEVVTVPPTLTGDGSNSILNIPVTIAGPGSADVTVTVTPKDGTGPFVDTFTWLITPLPLPGLVRVELVGRVVTPPTP